MPPPEGPLPPTEAAGRRIPALLTGYWAFGQFWGVWVIMVAELNRDHSLTYGENGLFLTVLSITAILVIAFIAPRMSAVALGVTTASSLLCLGVGAIMMAALPTSLLWLSFMVVGAGNGLIDVFLNVAAQRDEIRTRKPVLQWLHASYALGGITGAGVAGLIGSVDADYRLGLVFAGLALFSTAFWNSQVGSRERGHLAESSVFSLSAFRRHRGLVVPALAVLFAFLVEGSMDTWSGLYLQEELGASPGAAAFAFAAFSASLFIGRLMAGRVMFGLGPRVTILVAGIGAAIGGGIATFTSSPLVVGLAFLLMGFSIAAATPAGFSLVERVVKGESTNAIAAVTTVGYSGFVWSPPIFGWAAQVFDLRVAMALIVSSTLGIVVAGLIAPRGRPGDRRTPAEAPPAP